MHKISTIKLKTKQRIKTWNAMTLKVLPLCYNNKTNWPRTKGDVDNIYTR